MVQFILIASRKNCWQQFKPLYKHFYRHDSCSVSFTDCNIRMFFLSTDECWIKSPHRDNTFRGSLQRFV